MNNRLMPFLQALLAIPSEKGNTKALHDALDLVKKELGNEFTIENFESNGSPSFLAYVGKKRPEKFKIILNGHVDVVPASKEQYQPYEKDGKMYGRGAYDMKSGAAAMILLFQELAKKIAYPLGLQIVTDEEIGGYDGTEFQIKKGVTADFVIAGENTEMMLRNKAKGIYWLKLSTKGKAFHSAYPWKGENALWKMYDVLTILKKLHPIPKENQWITTMNLAKIETDNMTLNKIPDTCSAYLDIRYVPEDEQKIVADLEKALPKDVTIEVIIKDYPEYTEPTNSYLLALQKEVKKIMKEKGDLVGGNGSSDIRFYNKILHVGGVEFGPIGDNHHGDGEYVDVKSLQDYYQILKNFLLSFS